MLLIFQPERVCVLFFIIRWGQSQNIRNFENLSLLVLNYGSLFFPWDFVN